MKSLQKQTTTNKEPSNDAAISSTKQSLVDLQRMLILVGILFAAIISAQHHFPCIAQLYSSQEEGVNLKTGTKLNSNRFLPSKAITMHIIFNFFMGVIPMTSKTLKEKAQSTLAKAFAALKTMLPVAIEYMNMSFYPFAIFLPSIVLFFIVLSDMNAGNNGTTAILERRGARRIRKSRSGSSSPVGSLQISRQSQRSQFVACVTCLFLFLAGMISSAKSGHLIVLGLMSGVTPIMLIALTWFSVSKAEFLHCGVCFDEVDAEQWNNEQRLVRGGFNELACTFPQTSAEISALSQVDISLCKIANANFTPFSTFFFDTHQDKSHSAHFQDEAAISSVMILTAFFGIIAYNYASFANRSSAKGRRSLCLTLEAQALMTLFLAIIVMDHIFKSNQDNVNMKDRLQESRVETISLVTKMIGFNFVFLPFIAGGLYSIILPSGLFFLAIPLSSLVICSLVGLYHPSVANFVIFVTLLVLCVKVIFWTMSALFRVYVSIVRVHVLLIHLFILSALITYIIVWGK